MSYLNGRPVGLVGSVQETKQDISYLTDKQKAALIRSDIKDTNEKTGALLSDLFVMTSGGNFDTAEVHTLMDIDSGMPTDFSMMSSSGEVYASQLVQPQNNRKKGNIPLDCSKMTINEKVKHILGIRGEVVDAIDALRRAPEQTQPQSRDINELLKGLTYYQKLTPVRGESSDELANRLLSVSSVPEATVISIATPVPSEDDPDEILAEIQQLHENPPLQFDNSGTPLIIQLDRSWSGFSTLNQVAEYINDKYGVSTDSSGVIIALKLAMFGSEYSGLFNGYRQGLMYTIKSYRYCIIQPVCYNKTQAYLIYLDDGAETEFNATMNELSDIYGQTNIYYQALTSAIEGSGTVADLSGAIGLDYTTSSAKLKSVMRDVVRSGNVDSSKTAAALVSNYRAISGGLVVDDSHIEWGEAYVPTYDGSIGTAIIGIVTTAAQALATVLAFAGGLISKLAAVGFSLVSGILSAIQKGAAAIADTYPRISYDCIDNLIDYPLAQNELISISNLNQEAQDALSEHKRIKLINPYYVLFIYNPNEEYTGYARCKLFLNISARGFKAGFSTPYSYGTSEQSAVQNSGFMFYGGTVSPAEVQITGAFKASKGLIKDTLQELPSASTTKFNFYGSDLTFCDGSSKNAKDYPGLYGATISSVAYVFAASTFVSAGAGTPDPVIYDVQWANTSYSNNINSTSTSPYIEFKYSSAGSTQHIEFSNVLASALLCMFGFNYTETNADNAYSGPWRFSQYTDLGTAAYEDSFYEHVLEEVKHLVTWFGNGTCSVDRLVSNTAYLVSEWIGIDSKYAINNPTRSYKALVFAEVTTAVLMASLVIGSVVFKRVLRNRVQPKLQKNINALEKQRTALQEMEQLDGETAEEFSNRVDAEARDLYRNARRFNFKTKLLGMGSYDVAAGFWDGPTTIGGTWNVAVPDTDNSSLDIQTKFTKVSNLLNDENTDKVLEDTSDLSDDISVIEHLITGR